jgi:toxin-antitoxin system PIN domain toxin
VLLPDVNVLLAGFRTDHDHHRPARAFLEENRNRDILGLSDYVMASVVRLATSARVFVRPDDAATVVDYLDVLLETPGQLVRPGANHWGRFAGLCRDLRLRANLIPDAYLAALALDENAELITFDRGFARYPGLRWRPLLD